MIITPVAMAGNDIELEMKFWINSNGSIGKPSFQLGKGKIQYDFNNRRLELGKLRWDYKYPNQMAHKDDEDYLDVNTFRRYNLAEQ